MIDGSPVSTIFAKKKSFILVIVQSIIIQKSVFTDQVSFRYQYSAQFGIMGHPLNTDASFHQFL